ncbi:MAG TPA: hypothetical protein VGA05_06915 [Candidatus Bathyarchaeia archaeon]
MEPRNPYDPLRPMPIEPHPAPFRPPREYPTPREQELGRVLKELLDKLTSIENRLKTIEDLLKTRR